MTVEWSMRKLLFNLHLCVALVAAVFVVILGVTGSIMAFEPELGHLFHPHRAYVRPQGHALSLAELAAAATRAYPGKPVEGYYLSTSPDLSYQVWLGNRAVYVNQYTGEVLGEGSQGPDFLDRIHQLHLRLLLHDRRDSGKLLMSSVGVAILFLLFSGLYLWWPVKRVSVALGASSRRFWFDLHNAVGVFSLLFLLLLALTGVMIGFDDQLLPSLYRATGTKPAVLPSLQETPPVGAQPISPDQALAIARTALPGAAPILIAVPRPRDPYRIAARFPEDLTPGGRSRIAIDSYNGKVLLVQSSRAAPIVTHLVTLNRALHTGDILGRPSKAVMSLASLMLALQAVSGLTMWWKRLRARANSRLRASAPG